MKKLAPIFATFLLVLGTFTMGGIPSNASATGAQIYSGTTIKIGSKSYHVPTGTIVHTINGKGRTFKGQVASAQANVCYGRINWVTKGSGGKLLSRSYGLEKRSCSYDIVRARYNSSFSSNVRQACAELQINKVTKGAQCHWIH